LFEAQFEPNKNADMYDGLGIRAPYGISNLTNAVLDDDML
jgi:hypothetical protein